MDTSLCGQIKLSVLRDTNSSLLDLDSYLDQFFLLIKFHVCSYTHRSSCFLGTVWGPSTALGTGTQKQTDKPLFSWSFHPNGGRRNKPISQCKDLGEGSTRPPMSARGQQLSAVGTSERRAAVEGLCGWGQVSRAVNLGGPRDERPGSGLSETQRDRPAHQRHTGTLVQALPW